jgi:pyruvate/2-oxoglutarate dehydrogenase complex dihydrolipoamide acyltransferase (E2) component
MNNKRKMAKEVSYTVGVFPKNRDIVVEAVSMSKYYNHVMGFIEADVSKAVEIMDNYKKKTGETISLTAWVMRCMALVTSEIPETRTFKWRRRRTVTFDDVDVKCMIEREIEGKKIPIHYLFRKADKKSFKELQEELRSVVKKVEESRKDEKKQKRKQNILLKIPRFIRMIAWHFIMTNPFRTRKNLGVVGISSLSKFGRGMTGIVKVKTMHQTHCLVGSIHRKPVVVDDKIVIRDLCSLSLSFNHDIVDGGPAVNFARRISELMSQAFELDEYKV